MRFVKEVLKPGTYFVGDRRVVVTPQDCRDYFASLDVLKAAELDVPLMYEHTDPNRESGEGLPGEYKLDRAEQLRRTVGVVAFDDERNRISESGAVEVVFEVGDPIAAAQLSDQRIKFISPEMRPYWRDGLKREYSKLFTHFALTHRPIQVDQRPGFLQLSQSSDIMVSSGGVVQLSLADLEEVSEMPVAPQKLTKGSVAKFLAQFADDDEEDGGKKKPPVAAEGGESGGEAVKDAVAEAAAGMDESGEQAPPEANPDMPQAPNAEQDKKFEALLAHLAKAGIPLQSDTNDENLADRLLTALLTFNAMNDKAAAEGKDEDEGVEAKEQAAPLAQMSDPGRLSKARDKVARRIKRLANEGILQPVVAGRLLPQVGRLQFSDDGREHKDSAGLVAVLDAFEGAQSLAVPLMSDQSGRYQMSDGTEVWEESNPRGENYYAAADGVLADSQASKVAADLVKRHGYATK